MADFRLGSPVSREYGNRILWAPGRGPTEVPNNRFIDNVPFVNGVPEDRELLRELELMADELRGTDFDDQPDLPTEPLDSLAWYTSFRAGHHWGIHVRVDGRRQLGRNLVRLGMNGKTAYSASWHLLFNHEETHFQIDRVVEVLEQVVSLATGRATDLWLTYQQTTQPWSHLEEAMCNAVALKRALDHRTPMKPLERFVSSQPPGYREALSHGGTSQGSREECQSQLLSDYLRVGLPQGGERLPELASLMRMLSREPQWGRAHRPPVILVA